MSTKRIVWGVIAIVCFGILAIAAYLAPSLPSGINIDTMMASPSQMPPFGADMQGRPLTEYATAVRVAAIPCLWLQACLPLLLAASRGPRSIPWTGRCSIAVAFKQPAKAQRVRTARIVLVD